MVISRKLILLTIFFLNPVFANQTFNWDGVFIGGFLGYSWNNSNATTLIGAVGSNPQYFSSIQNINSVAQSGTGKITNNFFLGGGLIEANKSWDNLIYSILLDIRSYNNKKTQEVSNSYPTFPASYLVSTSVQTNWLFTARGRVGYLNDIFNYNMIFPYFTTGVALTNYKVANAFSDNAVSLGVSTGNLDYPRNLKHNKTGWTVGTGFAMHLTKKLTLNAEYLYVNFSSGKANNSIVCSANSCQNYINSFVTTANLNSNIFQIGLNLKVY